MKKAVIGLMGGIYHVFKSDSSSLSTLGDFLTNDTSSEDNSWLKKWIANPTTDITGGNTTSLEKLKDKIIITSDVNKNANEFEISKKDFLKLVDRWEKLYKQKPKEIIITYDNDTLTLEANNKIVPEVEIRYRGKKYWHNWSNDIKLKNLALFLIHTFEPDTFSQAYLLDKWIDDKREASFQNGKLLLEKNDVGLSIFHTYQNLGKEFAFVTTKEKLREIYTNFQQLKMLQTKIIRIYKDGDEIKLEGLAEKI